MTEDVMTTEKQKRIRSWLIVLGVILLVALVAFLKEETRSRAWLGSVPAATSLEENLSAGRPAIVFFHSPDCSSCNQVQASLDAVYPEFRDAIALLGADVTDLRERELVERVGVQTAPTLLLVDAGGNEKLIVGEISPQELRDELLLLAGGIP